MREAIRAALVALFGRQRWSFLVWYRERFGLLKALAAAARLPLYRGLGSVPGPAGQRFVFVRPGTADQQVYDQVFVTQDYALSLGAPRVIVDAGAHIGLATIYFADRFPNVRILAVEPETRNYELLLRNVAGLQSVTCVHAGVWSHATHLRIVDDAAETWGFTVSEAAAGCGIRAVGISKLMREHNLERIDLLKIDIEGSEVEVLSTAADWLDRVDTLLIELHDRFRPGCTQALESALAEYDFAVQPAGDCLMISKLRKRDRVCAAN